MVNRLRWNEKSVRDAEPAQGRDYQIFDTEARGFAVCIYLPGDRAFTIDYRHAGRQRRMTIGRWPERSTTAARERPKELRREIDAEGEVLEVLAQSRRNKRAALKLMRKLLKKRGYVPDAIVTDKLGSYSAALRELGLVHLHGTGGRLNNRAEVSHPLPGSGLRANHERKPTRRRERRMGRFKSPGSMQRFLSVHDAIYNYINLQRLLISRQNLHQTRARAFAEWFKIVAA